MSQMNIFYNNYIKLFKARTPIILRLDNVTGIGTVIKFHFHDGQKVLVFVNLPFRFCIVDEQISNYGSDEDIDEDEEMYRNLCRTINYGSWARDKEMRNFIIENARLKLSEEKLPNVYTCYNCLSLYQKVDFIKRMVIETENQTVTNEHLVLLELIEPEFEKLKKFKKPTNIYKRLIKSNFIDLNFTFK